MARMEPKFTPEVIHQKVMNLISEDYLNFNLFSNGAFVVLTDHGFILICDFYADEEHGGSYE